MKPTWVFWECPTISAKIFVTSVCVALSESGGGAFEAELVTEETIWARFSNITGFFPVVVVPICCYFLAAANWATKYGDISVLFCFSCFVIFFAFSFDPCFCLSSLLGFVT